MRLVGRGLPGCAPITSSTTGFLRLSLLPLLPPLVEGAASSSATPDMLRTRDGNECNVVLRLKLRGRGDGRDHGSVKAGMGVKM